MVSFKFEDKKGYRMVAEGKWRAIDPVERKEIKKKIIEALSKDYVIECTGDRFAIFAKEETTEKSEVIAVIPGEELAKFVGDDYVRI